LGVKNIMEYCSDFTHDLKIGQEGEKLVAEMVEGDKVEIKSEQDQYKDTGNVFVEFSSRGKASGIAITEAKWWAINFMIKGEHQSTSILSTDRLKKMVKERGKYRIVNGGDNNTSRGFLVPIKDLT
tara:strand:+ start:94 stop:471 length:378 start_codon:yes stop_codon:yes gene_type:complete